jgi:hypothetical protein
MAAINKVGDLNIGVADTRARAHTHDNTEWIYLFRGTTGSGQTDKIQRFDPEINGVETHMTMPEANSHACVEKVSGLFYTIAGEYTTNIYEVDVETQSVTQIGTVAQGTLLKDHIAAAPGDGYIYYWGGSKTDTGDPQYGIYRLDPSSGSVSEVGTLDYHVRDGTGHAVDGTMYSLAQQATEETDVPPTSRVDKISPSGSQTKVADLMLDGSARAYFRARGAINNSGKIVTGGGKDADGAISDVYEIDPSTWGMNKLGDLNINPIDTQAGFSSTTDSVYIFGGHNGTTAIYEVEFGVSSDFVFIEGSPVLTE